MPWKIGISMREHNANNYQEERDALARDWYSYMNHSFPEDLWMCLPNLENWVIPYIEKWGINVIILSGGDDLGLYPKRDRTELLLIKHAMKNSIPIIAVCRGMQLIHNYFDGNLVSGSDRFIKYHRATQHLISTPDGDQLVNSYHNNFIEESSLSSDFEVIARCKQDNTIEAFEGNNVLALMWHPERTGNKNEWTTELIKKFINRNLYI